MKSFEIFPAIDLRGGAVVRLQQGDPEKATTYNSDPLAVAQQWQAAGSHWLHVINLDGALDEADDVNIAALQALSQSQLKIQFGGGMRSASTIERVLNLGITRVILGTLVLEDPHTLPALVQQFGAERIVVGLDSRDGILRSHGWKQASDYTPQRAAEFVAKAGVRTLIVTDIRRDGMGSGPNLPLAASLVASTGLDVIAAGGVKTLEHLRSARSQALAGIVIGRALYDGSIELTEALQC